MVPTSRTAALAACILTLLAMPAPALTRRNLRGRIDAARARLESSRRQMSSSPASPSPSGSIFVAETPPPAPEAPDSQYTVNHTGVVFDDNDVRQCGPCGRGRYMVEPCNYYRDRQCAWCTLCDADTEQVDSACSTDAVRTRLQV